jgi:hypothetical protein
VFRTVRIQFERPNLFQGGLLRPYPISTATLRHYPVTAEAYLQDHVTASPRRGCLAVLSPALCWASKAPAGHGSRPRSAAPCAPSARSGASARASPARQPAHPASPRAVAQGHHRLNSQPCPRGGTSYRNSAIPAPTCRTATNFQGGLVTRRGNRALPRPRVTEATWTMTSSSRPAS